MKSPISNRWTRFRVSALALSLSVIFEFFWGVSAAAPSPAGTPAPAAVPSSSPNSAESPAPGIAYDEIARIIKSDATPPPPGTFDVDASVIAALPPMSLPKPPSAGGALGNTLAMGALTMIPIVGGLIASAAIRAHAAAAKAAAKKQHEEALSAMAARQKAGVLAGFAFYHGWSRLALTPEFTTIEKPDQGLSITLNTTTKTYQSFQTAANVETYTVQSGTQTAAQPTLEKDPIVEPLPPAKIAGYSARGYRTSGSINVPQMTFFCSAGLHQIVETEYVSELADPQYNSSLDPANAQALVTACALTSSVSHRDPGRLVLYRVVTVDEGTPTAFSVALERGNIRTIDKQDTALFSPPADFKETK